MKLTSTQIHHQTFALHPTGALYWKETDMLLIADVHLGKVSHFRKHGSAVPQDAIYKNFEQLDLAITAFDPKVVCFMGDLFHSSLNTEWTLFEEWIQHYSSIQFVLIAGNHDIISPIKYEKLGIDVTDEWCIGTILLTHHPENRDGCYNIAGHIHPGVRLLGQGKQQLRIACFFKQPAQLILPAFGTFTGKHLLDPTPEDEVFVIAEEEVIKL